MSINWRNKKRGDSINSRLSGGSPEDTTHYGRIYTIFLYSGYKVKEHDDLRQDMKIIADQPNSGDITRYAPTPLFFLKNLSLMN